MTIQVRITNEDAVPSRAIQVFVGHYDNVGSKLGPGESGTYHVWKSSDLRIVEIDVERVPDQESNERTA